MIHMLGGAGAVGGRPPRCVALIVHHCGLAFTPAAVGGVGTSLKSNGQTHTDTHGGSDELSLATSALSSNVLIMIWLVCNYSINTRRCSYQRGIQACGHHCLLLK